MIRRELIVDLEKWRYQKDRKPMMLRGARQVGKTTLVSGFGASFKHFVSLNLERKTHKSLFEASDEVSDLLGQILFQFNIPIEEISDCLLFIDEIQAYPAAIKQLRFWYEFYPELSVIAAGSLLEFTLKDVVSFPVGRVQFMYLYPISFTEYLSALGASRLVDAIQEIPLPKAAHNALMKHYQDYMLIGGMPEMVAKYIENKDLVALQPLYESLWQTYKSDVENYANIRGSLQVIRYLLEVAHLQLDKRIKFDNFGGSNYRSREVGEAFRALESANILQMVYPTTVLQPPLIPSTRRAPRLQYLDTGILHYLNQSQAAMLRLQDFDSMYKGALMPHLVFQELQTIQRHSKQKLHFWVREKKQSTAEVDLVLQYQDYIVPVEIKSGSTGKLRSLQQFIDGCNHPYAVRLFAENFGVERHQTIAGKPFLLMNIPFYLGAKLPEYIAYFVENYSLED